MEPNDPRKGIPNGFVRFFFGKTHQGIFGSMGESLVYFVRNMHTPGLGYVFMIVEE